MHFNHLQLKITNLILTLSEKVTKINKITKQTLFIFMQTNCVGGKMHMMCGAVRMSQRDESAFEI